MQILGLSLNVVVGLVLVIYILFLRADYPLPYLLNNLFDNWFVRFLLLLAIVSITIGDRVTGFGGVHLALLLIIVYVMTTHLHFSAGVTERFSMDDITNYATNGSPTMTTDTTSGDPSQNQGSGQAPPVNMTYGATYLCPTCPVCPTCPSASAADNVSA